MATFEIEGAEQATQPEYWTQSPITKQPSASGGGGVTSPWGRVTSVGGGSWGGHIHWADNFRPCLEQHPLGGGSNTFCGGGGGVKQRSGRA